MNITFTGNHYGHTRIIQQHAKQVCQLLGLELSSLYFVQDDSITHQAEIKITECTSNRAIIYLNWRFIDSIPKVIAHELCHVWQVYTEQLAFYADYVHWQGIHGSQFELLAYKNRPWEAQAYQFEADYVQGYYKQVA